MIRRLKNQIIHFKLNDFYSVKEIEINLQQNEYKSDLILEIDFQITSKLIKIFSDCKKLLEKSNKVLIIIHNPIDEFLLSHEFLVFVPSIKEAVDYIELERINRDLGI
tara:strand:+ start:533 stop:856 length:324 start_codon:yes stop_codon:yes gene_type:complete